LSDVQPGGGNVASFREVYQLVDKTRVELLSEIKGVSSHVDAALLAHQAEHVRHNAEHDQHEQEHKQDAWNRSSLVRWGVTTVLAGMGVIAGLVAALTDIF
jgi:hypothetical protein